MWMITPHACAKGKAIGLWRRRRHFNFTFVVELWLNVLEAILYIVQS